VNSMSTPIAPPSRPAELAADLAARCGRIDLLVMDVDGVLTDGVIELNDHGIETKHFHVRDGSAISLWQKAGKRAAILSGRRAKAVEIRAAELGITPVVQGAAEKGEAFQEIVAGFGLDASQACYMGDDVADLPAVRAAGLAACPADAAPEIRHAVHYVARATGGRGAVREVVELVLKQQGVWERLIL
jgi:3-deoxy-D-manno-octulosonate 8-phosphate phosphatase (KDO 8-P phosphatase)